VTLQTINPNDIMTLQTLEYKMKDNLVVQHQQKQLTPDSRSLHINLHIYLIRRIYVVAQASLATDPSHTARVAAG